MTIKTLEASRYILSSYTLLSQLLRIFNRSLLAGSEFEDGVRNGSEKTFEGGVGERVIRLGGKKSDLTVVSLDRYGPHIFPIFEDPLAVRHLVRRHSREWENPIYHKVERNSYGYSRSYVGLNVRDDWLIKTTVGGHLLIVEGEL